MGSPFEFTPSGKSGIPVSSMFPHTAKVVDELAIVRSMTSPLNEHAQANFFMHTGFPTMGYPSAGAWAAYGLGTENRDLPGYVVLQSGSAVPPHGGVSLFSNGFLPGQHQGSILKADQREAIRNIRPRDPQMAQRRRLDFVRQFDQPFLEETAADAQVEAAIRNYETAFRMQSVVPELCDISGETPETHKLYGLDSDDAEKSAYARQCLLARRLIERGVRFIELSCLTKNIGAGGAANPWDQHGALKQGHGAMANQVDQPIAALIEDLRRRDLLKDTLIVWAGEFGRTPFSQGSDGRDHNPYGFSVWLADRVFFIADLRPDRPDARRRFAELVRERLESGARDISDELISSATSDDSVGVFSRVTLEWSGQPEDLDLHCYVFDGESLVEHIFYGRTWSSDCRCGVKIDTDERDGGKETIAFQGTPSVDFVFAVYNFSNESPLNKSNAVVTYSLADGRTMRFSIPKQGEGRWWHVCMSKMWQESVSVVNEITDDEPRRFD